MTVNVNWLKLCMSYIWIILIKIMSVIKISLNVLFKQPWQVLNSLKSSKVYKPCHHLTNPHKVLIKLHEYYKKNLMKLSSILAVFIGN